MCCAFVLGLARVSTPAALRVEIGEVVERNDKLSPARPTLCACAQVGRTDWACLVCAPTESRHRGTPWRTAWKPAVSACGLEGLRVHDLRHTFVSLLISSGANVKQVSTWAGHSSVTVTLDTYTHLFQDDGDDIADRMDLLLSARSEGAQVRSISG